MDTLLLREQISRTDDDCRVVVANTPELLAECFRLRHQVYCVERNFEPDNNGRETDQFDERARHVLLIDRESGQSVGTVRVIPPARSLDLGGLPMAQFCSTGLLRKLPIPTTGEISRFAVSKQRRKSCHAGSMVRLGLMQGIVRASGELGLTHWCAIMEPILLRLLQTNAIRFTPLGSLIEHRGMRQPSSAHIGNVLEQIRVEQWHVWNYVTLGGTLWHDSPTERLIA